MHVFQGKEAFEVHFEEQIRSQSSLDPALVEHFHKLARMFLFEEDPDQADLDAEKDIV